MAITLDSLASMSQTQLDDLFRTSPMGEIPDGDAKGTAIVKPGTPVAGIKMVLARWLAWQGKVFYRDRGWLVNKVSPLGLHLIKADVYVQNSWMDGQPAIILDYSEAVVRGASDPRRDPRSQPRHVSRRRVVRPPQDDQLRPAVPARGGAP